MGILDLHARALESAAADSRLYVPQRQPPAFSVWDAAAAIPRGAVAGIGEMGASAFEVASGLADGMRRLRDATPEQMREYDRVGTIKPDDFRTAFGRAMRDEANSWMPDPATTHASAQVVAEFSRMLGKVAATAPFLGPVGAAGVVGMEEGFTVSDKLAQDGVDLETRSHVGAVTAGITAATFALPIAGDTIKSTAALALGGGPLAYIGQQAATREILNRADYSHLADRYDPFDPVGLALSTLLPLGFGAMGLRAAGKARAKQAAKDAAKAEADFMAGPVPSEKTAVSRAVDMQMEDAARVSLLDEVSAAHRLTPDTDLAGSAAHDAAMARAMEQIAAREPVDVSGLVQASADSVIERRLAQKIARDFDAAANEYAALKDSEGGKILNTDTARELSPDYMADRTKSAAVHEPASQFVKDLYAKKLAEEPKPGEANMVLFTAGGTGAGKTSAIRNLSNMKELASRAQIIYDTNMNGYASSKAKVEQALAAGKAVEIVMVARDPVDALVNGALPRAEKQRAKFGTGRTVPVSEHIKTHQGAVETVRRLADEYADNPSVRISVIDNSLGANKAEQRDVAWLKRVSYNDIEQRVTAALEKAYEEGQISTETYRGFSGKGASADVAGAVGEGARVPPPDRPGNGGVAEQRVSEGLNKAASALEAELPDMPVMMDGMTEAVPLSTLMERVRAEAASDMEQAPLIEVAAACALRSAR